MTMAESKTTTDPKVIQEWAEAREGRPAHVKSTGSSKDAGLLRINFPGGAEDALEDITWEEFFQKFEDSKLAFLYQEETAAGKISRFNKIISRETADEKKKPAASTKTQTKSKPGANRKSAAKPKAEAGKTASAKSTAAKKSTAKSTSGKKK